MIGKKWFYFGNRTRQTPRDESDNPLYKRVVVVL